MSSDECKLDVEHNERPRLLAEHKHQQDAARSGAWASKVGVVVLGMGRSGTSAITRMFIQAGFFAGSDDDLLPATEANPTGHWENAGVWRANERIFEQLGGNWFDPPAEAIQLAARARVVPTLIDEIKRIRQQAVGRPIVLKDPRIGVLMPLWIPVIAGRLQPVLAIRDPLEIALSLNSRDKTSLPFGLAAWELHMTSLLSHLGGLKVVVAPYERLVNENGLGSQIVEIAACHIDPSLTVSLQPNQAPTAFWRILHHNHAASFDHKEYLTTHQLDLWKYLSSLTTGEQDMHAPERFQCPSDGALSTVAHETERAVDKTRHNELASALRSEYDQLAKTISAERAQNNILANLLAEEQSRVTTLADEVSSERARLKAVETEQAQAARWLESMRTSMSWRITAPLRRIKSALRGA